MENHPIPQDVTGFKFKIIGSMTVKQFAYIVAAGIFCTLTFLAMNKNHPILMIPLMGAFAGIGFSLAFVPVGGRPLDKMLVYFAKSIPKENQFLYHKQGVDLNQYEFFKPPKVVQAQTTAATQSNSDIKKNALASALRNSYFRPDDEEVQYISSLKASFENPAGITTPPRIQKTPDLVAPEAVKPVMPTAPIQADTLPEQVPAAAVQPVIPPPAPEPEPVVQSQPTVQTAPQQTPTVSTPRVSELIDEEPQKPEEIVEEINEIKTQEQNSGYTTELETRIKELEKKLAEAQGQTQAYQQQVLTDAKQMPKNEAVIPTVKEVPKTENVKSITPSGSLSSGFPVLPDIPNIVLGIVKDPRGKVLPNILVEVVDTNEIPVRAFKTNALGQFISATPLPNGIFKIYFEDPSKAHEFETVQIEMNGEIFNPIEILSVDQREKLRRELFGNGASQPTAPVAGA